ncbi:snRNA-activating protein complex subunit 1 [Trichonephila clavipes]|nr:snRNA-activating protein complex subunit 1 [Trichonephila clavipes]
MDKVKFIAEGFLTDAEKLLGDFVKENSMDFSVFVELWKKHKFSLIYLGRPNEKELNDFTREIFYLSTKFLYSTSLLYQVGGIFLLYALYRNQVLSPPAKIRILSDQFKSILSLRDTVAAYESRSLHYVINYLIENSFDFVAYPRLMGPLSVSNTEVPDKILSEFNSSIQTAMESDLTEFVDSNLLKEIDELYAQYVEACQSLNISALSVAKSGKFKNLSSRMDKLLKWVNKTKSVPSDLSIKNKEPKSPPPQETVPQINIGSRRAQLKAFAFGGTLPSDGSTENLRSKEENEFPCNGTSVPDASVPKKRTWKSKKKIGQSRRCTTEEVDERPEFESNPNLIKDAAVGVKRRRRRREAFTRTRRYCMVKVDGSSNQTIPSTDFSSNFLSMVQLNIDSDSGNSELSDEIDDAPPSINEGVESLHLSSV